MTEKTSGEMARGNLDLMVLSALAGESMYGYLIQQSLAEATGGMVTVKAGTLSLELPDQAPRALLEEATGVPAFDALTRRFLGAS